MRYDQLTYDLCIDDDILDNSIVKLTLQPLVENAIYHGLFGIRRGQIRILGRWSCLTGQWKPATGASCPPSMASKMSSSGFVCTAGKTMACALKASREEGPG